MPDPADVLATLHLVLLIGFIGVTSLLMLMTTANRLRLRRVVRSWRAGRFFGLPVWPIVFVGLILGLLLADVAGSGGAHMLMLAGYGFGGLCWLVSAVLSSTVVITEYGIIENVNRAERAVAWGQVVDYFETTRGKQRYYVFFFVDGAQVRRRFELLIPPNQQAAFCAVIRAKLDARFEFAAQQAYGKKALEG